MKTKLSTFFSLIILACLPLSANAELDEQFVFGDSSSDTGNLASIPGAPQFPPFYFMQSRVSDGPVAVEGLAQKLGPTADPSLHLDITTGIEGTNYAVAGANAAGFDIINLETQVNAFRPIKTGSRLRYRFTSCLSGATMSETRATKVSQLQKNS